jgi:effector-binding domain-containing protein
VKLLRDLDLPVREIAELMAKQEDQQRLVEALAKQKWLLKHRIRNDRHSLRRLDEFLAMERIGATVTDSLDLEEKVLAPILVACIRTRGKYSDCGKLFGTLFRGAGRMAGGSPMLLHHDTEYKEEDADFEVCLPLKASRMVKGASVRELPGGRCISLIHRGPYEELGRSYGRIMVYMKEKGYAVVVPSREVYIRGPGMIFRGNPKKYITEIQVMVEG